MIGIKCPNFTTSIPFYLAVTKPYTNLFIENGIISLGKIEEFAKEILLDNTLISLWNNIFILSKQQVTSNP